MLTIAIFLMYGAGTAEAAYSIGFSSPDIAVTSPGSNNASCDKVLTVTGTSSLNQIWLCLRGPDNQITTYPVAVENGIFSVDVWLRFGPGKYTVWAGDNGKVFNGLIRFEVQNTSAEDYFSLTPSGFVDSNSEAVTKLASTLVTDNMPDLAKARAIYDWVTRNISYDTQAYYSGNIGLNTATEVLHSGKATCSGYAFAFAALARVSGIPARIVYGDAWNNSGKTYEKHAWNEAFIDGKWISLDPTWDAGYLKNQSFVQSSSEKYFNVEPDDFARTHQNASIMLY